MYSLINNFLKNLIGFSKRCGNAALKVLNENLKLILIGVISILMIIAAAIVISLYFGGDVARELVITDIKGSVYIERDSKRLGADKNSRLRSGDIITTDENAAVRISLDNDKHIFVEPNSVVYIYFTDIASKGDISVNLSRGAVICRLGSELRKNASFILKTPNSVVSVRGTVFRTQFDFVEDYMGYSNVMITQVQNFDGAVTLQLYDNLREPFDLPMLLLERASAQMLTSEDICQYGYLNYDIDLLSLSEDTLLEILRAGNEKQIGFASEEINIAYKSVMNRGMKTDDMTATEIVSEIPSVTTSAPTTATESAAPVSEITAVPSETPSETTSYDTLRTTQKRQEYTTYSGVKWWELTGNTNTGTNGYEDWFTEEPDGLGAGTVTSVPEP